MHRHALVSLLLASPSACDAVPDVMFVNADGGTDGGCPGEVPAFATVCCGVIPCGGPNCVDDAGAACTDCQKCSPLDLCCPNAQHVASCKMTLTCP
jgi:hypothetical protein